MTPLLSSALLRTQSDERLLALASAGHDRAFEAIVDRYRRPLLRYLHRLLPGDRAEDVLQAALVSAWTALREGVAVRDLRPWLYRICHNGAVNALARRSNGDVELHEALRGSSSPVEDLVSRDALRRTLASVAELPERQRAALLAVAVEGRPHGEVARELGMTDGALRQLVHRARSAVRSAVTAVTPAPLMEWLAQQGVRGAGVAGVAKAVAIVAATGSVVAGGAAHVVSHEAGAAVAAAAAASPRSIVHTAPARTHRAQVRWHAPRHVRHHARRQHRHRLTVLLGGHTEHATPPVKHRRVVHRRPVAPVTVTHGGSTQENPTPPATPSDPPAQPAPDPPATTPTVTESTPPPAPPAECHEVACRPATTPTEPPPATQPPPTEPPPAPPPPTSDPPRI